MNINTREYWENRFSTGNWEECQGREQTALFAKAQIKILKIPEDFPGSILDFGCGLGDSIPILRERFKKASLIGMDIATSAIDMCRKKYGHLATFIDGNYEQIPEIDVIIASNVFEHLSNDKEIAKILLSKCKELFIVVPYKEHIVGSGEHVNSYDEHYFDDFRKCEFIIFPSRGWSQFGWELFYKIYFKNIIRYLCGKPLRRRNLQIMFHLRNN